MSELEFHPNFHRFYHQTFVILGGSFSLVMNVYVRGKGHLLDLEKMNSKELVGIHENYGEVNIFPCNLICFDD